MASGQFEDPSFITRSANETLDGSVVFHTNRAIAVINGDGISDIVSESLYFDGSSYSYLEVFLGNSEGGFTALEPIDLDYNPNSSGDLVLDDFNADGIIDALSTSGDSIFIGDGEGGFSVKQMNVNILDNSIVADFNGDGAADFSNSTSNGQLLIYLNDGSGNFSFNQTSSPDAGGGNPVIDYEYGDFDNDGIEDMLSMSFSAGATLFFKGNGDGSFAEGTTSGLTTSLNIYMAGDFNGDGNRDVILTGGSLFLGNGQGGFTDSGENIGNTNAGSRAIDFDDDGDLDVISADGGVLYYIENLGNASFSQQSTTNVSDITLPSEQYLNISDINDDGALDIELIGTDQKTSYEYSSILSQTEDVSATGDISVSDQESAKKLLAIVDLSLDNLLEKRSKIGSNLNRLQSAANSNLLTTENLSTALSNIQDTNIANETAELVTSQILQQAQIASFTQANNNLQLVLRLLFN